MSCWLRPLGAVSATRTGVSQCTRRNSAREKLTVVLRVSSSELGGPALRLAQRVPKIHSLVAVAIEAATTDGLIRREVCPLTSGCAARLIKA